MIPYFTQIKWAAGIAAFAGYTWLVYDVTSTYAKAKALEEVAQQQADTIKNQKVSEGVSFDAGEKYEKKRTAIRAVVNKPDRKLDEDIQGPDGDVMLPGSLGVRLNSIASVRAPNEAASVSGGPLH